MSDKTLPYRVLARKYRPQNFDELIGQEALVRTLKNAIESGRIAHAFMLTGVRGVGKTTTARIIAKALNYTGKDGKAGPTTGPTDDCDVCRAIAEDRHPDVMEMDAASRTGVDDIREILDGVRYAPTSARYKVYIIDEVHMLSKQAFNALLKTLEEPPEHVKFIFATTEIRKVPVTVLSRCQRFDLRRVDVATLSGHYKAICKKENVACEDEAIALIARAADGSVRDGLSLLDQAIALGGAKVTAEQVKDMLGLTDRAKVMDLLGHILCGEAPEALAIMDDLYRAGADPAMLIQDLLDLVHVMTRLRVVPKMQGQIQTMTRDELERAADLASKLSMPTLGRAWNILLKGLNEVSYAPNPQKAAEMVIIRLIYAADLPDPADLLKKLQDGTIANASAPSSAAAPTRQRAPVAIQGGRRSAALAINDEPETEMTVGTTASITSLQDIVALLQEAREANLASQVWQFAHLVRLEEGRLEIRPEPEAPAKMASQLAEKLKNLTGRRWMVTVSGAPGAPTLAQEGQANEQAILSAVRANPMVQKIFEVFPGAQLTAVHNEKKN